MNTRPAAATLALGGLVVLLAIGSSGCFVLDALGFVKSPLLPTVAGTEDASLVESLQGTLAVAGAPGPPRYQLIRYPSRDARTIRLPADTLCADANLAQNSLIYVTWESGVGDPDTWALRMARLDTPQRAVDVVAGSGSVSRAETGIGEHGEWAAISWDLWREDLVTAENVTLVSLPDKRFLWTRATGCIGRVAVVEDLELVLFTTRDSWAHTVRMRSFDAATESELASGELLAFEHATRIALVRDGSATFTVSVPDGARLLDRARIPGLAGQVLLLHAGQLAVYEALPTEGVPQERYRLGLRAPEPYSTIKLCDLETGAFVTLVTRAFYPGSFAFPDMPP